MVAAVVVTFAMAVVVTMIAEVVVVVVPHRIRVAVLDFSGYCLDIQVERYSQELLTIAPDSRRTRHVGLGGRMRMSSRTRRNTERMCFFTSSLQR